MEEMQFRVREFWTKEMYLTEGEVEEMVKRIPTLKRWLKQSF